MNELKLIREDEMLELKREFDAMLNSNKYLDQIAFNKKFYENTTKSSNFVEKYIAEFSKLEAPVAQEHSDFLQEYYTFLENMNNTSAIVLLNLKFIEYVFATAIESQTLISKFDNNTRAKKDCKDTLNYIYIPPNVFDAMQCLYEKSNHFGEFPKINFYNTIRNAMYDGKVAPDHSFGKRINPLDVFDAATIQALKI